MKKIVNWFKSLKSSKDEVTESEIDDKKKFEGTDRAFGATHPGMRRPNNEDAFKIHLNEIFIVADGMGGHNAGEVASSLAVTTIKDFLYKKGDIQDSKQIKKALVESIFSAHEEIKKKSERDFVHMLTKKK